MSSCSAEVIAHIYGSKDGRIVELVRELTLARKLRLVEIENFLIRALEQDMWRIKS
jgi:hypothetical protein